MIRLDLTECFEKASFSQYLNESPIILNFLNQVAHGSERDAERMAVSYSGSYEFGRELHRVARQIIKEPEGGWDARR